MHKMLILCLTTLCSLIYGGVVVPFSEIDEWIDNRKDIKHLRGNNYLEKKASFIHSIDRRDIKVGLKRDGYGEVDFLSAQNLLSNADIAKGEIVSASLEKDEIHYYYYSTNKPSSIKATLAFKEDKETDLNVRVIRDGRAIRSWAKDQNGCFTRSLKESGTSVERVDLECSDNKEIIIKVSSPNKNSNPVDYVLLVSGCQFSNRQLSNQELRERLKKNDEQRADRVRDYLRRNKVNRDSVFEDLSYRQIIDIEDGKPVYYKTFNATAAKSISLNKIRPNGVQGLNLTGSNLERSLGVWDAGTVRSTHQEVTGRVIIVDNVAPHSHSSHVGGTMIASGIKPEAKGMATEATLSSYDWLSDQSEMASAANNGLIISQHSYGIPKNYTYSKDWDVIAHQYPMYTISKSASNDGAFRTVSKHGNAKNVITLGSGMDQPNGWEGPKTNATVLSYFSSKGPAPDGRIKPDILANGHGLYSMVETGNSSYGTKSGTSMSGPSFAGACALLQEHYYNTHQEAYMSSATLKALVIHSADEIDADGPDYSSGWGYMNAARAAEIITNDDGGAMGVIQEPTLNNGDEFIIEAVRENNEDVEVTIVWNDPVPTSNTGKALVNDLDLRVFNDGTEHLPWMMDWNGSTHNIKAQKGDNNVDNVEKVQIKNASGSDVRIVVTHKGSLKNGSQQFSIILTGAIINTDPFVKVTSPNGDEEFEQYSNSQITWSSNVDEPVDIILLRNGSVVDTLAKTYTNSGSFNWLIPEDFEISNDYRIKVACITSTDIEDESDDNFSIIEEYIISEFPYTETFDTYAESTNVIGKWIQENDSDDIDWLVYSGVTPTGQYGVNNGNDPGTGPLGDHTSGEGNYIYLEASYNYEDNKKALVSSPKIDIRTLIEPKLVYWLNMNSIDGKMGEITFDIKTQDEWTNSVKSYSGDKGLNWFSDTIDLSGYVDKRLQFRLNATVGDSFYSDICIDDISIIGRENHAPIFITHSLTNGKEGVEYNSSITVSDEDQDSLYVTMVSGPTWLSVEGIQKDTIILNGIPEVGNKGVKKLELELSDGYATTKKSFDINIIENSLPVFSSTPITNSKVTESYEYNITLTDTDEENELEIESSSLPTWLTLDDKGNGKALLSGTPSLGDSGNFEITLFGDDGVSTTPAEQQFVIDVEGAVTAIHVKKKDYKTEGFIIEPSVLDNSSNSMNFYLRSPNAKIFELNIIDCVGNKIYSSKGIINSQSKYIGYYYLDSWNGYNDNDIKVGSGTYNLIVKITNFDGLKTYYKTSVGIKR